MYSFKHKYKRDFVNLNLSFNIENPNNVKDNILILILQISDIAPWSSGQRSDPLEVVTQVRILVGLLRLGLQVGLSLNLNIQDS